ncbi:MAG: hypothetical protein ACLRQF_04480 [Thomasclavelia ramosa]
MTKLSLLEDELSGATQVIVDIYSRYLFESRFFEKRETGALSVEEIEELMIQAQKMLMEWFRSSIPSSIYVDLEITLLLCRLFFL